MNAGLEAAAASAKSAAPGLLESVSTLSVATKVTTVISLAALAVIVAFLLARQWQASRRRVIEQAVERGDTAVLDRVLGNSGVALGGLSAEQKYAIARDEINKRFWTRLLGYGFTLLAFIALLVVIVMLLTPSKARAEVKPIDPLTMAGLLKYVPPDERMTQCRKTLDQGQCDTIVALLGNTYAKPSTEVQEVVDNSLDTGTVTPVFASAVSTRLPVSVRSTIVRGDPKGWDIVFYYCGGPNAALNEKRARAAAAALGTTPGETLAPGIVLGTIQISARDAGTQVADAPVADDGRIVLSDDGPGKAAAVAEIVKTLGERSQGQYAQKTSATAKRWQIQLFDCAARPRIPVDVISQRPLRPVITKQ